MRARTLSLAILALVTRITAHPTPHRSTSTDVAVLYSTQDPEVFRTACPEGRCTYLAVEDFRCGRVRARTVIVSGHALPPDMYLNHTPEEVGEIIRCLAPELVVADVCYGMSEPLLREIARDPVRRWVLGATSRVSPKGFVYGADFFSPERTARERASLVTTQTGEALERWETDIDELDDARSRVDRWSRDELLTKRLVRRHPNLLLVEPRSVSTKILFAVPPERFR